MLKNENDIIITLLLGTTLLFVLSAVIIIAIISYNKKQKKLLLEKQQMQIKFDQALLQTQIEIQEQTLKNISQEIHDNIGQVLSLAKLNLATFAYMPDAATQTKVDDAKQLIGKALHDLRDLSRSLHGDRIAELGLHASIGGELKIMQNTGQFTTGLQISGNPYKLEPQKEMVLFRMVQEALNNAIKHSKAKKIEVQLQYEPALFRLSVTDNGIGFNPATLQLAEKGIGLKNMQNRAELIGAIFLLQSNAVDGTRITIELKCLTS